MLLTDLPVGWKLARCDWPSRQLRGELVALSPSGLTYRPLARRSDGTVQLFAEAPVTAAMDVKEDEPC